MQHFLEVVLPIPLERNFTYRINDSQAGQVQRGMRVAVPFGKSGVYTALALEVHTTEPQGYEAKDIHQLLDETPIVTEVQLQHWQWIATYYMCSLGEVVRAGLPNAFLLESESLILANQLDEVDESDLQDDEFLVYEALRHQSTLKVSEIGAIVDRKNSIRLIQSLLEKGIAIRKEQIRERYKPKMVRYLKVASEYREDAKLEALLETLKRAPKQSTALLSLFQLENTSSKPIPVSQVVSTSGVSSAVIKTLIDKGVCEEYYLRQDRVAYKGEPKGIDYELNEEQAKALEKINADFAEDKVCLLHGITSSGKTMVYSSLIAQMLAQDKQVLYLLPEIALTSQLIGRLQYHFGDMVSVYHSKYNANERVEVWNNVLHSSPKAKIVIGARSSLFLPFSKLGLLIVDEEHEASFKQHDPAPRYHARDAAIVLSKLQNAHCLLGSATPSLESIENAKTGKYGYAQMKRRYGNVLLPEIQLVDIKEATKKKKMKGHFSTTLTLAIEEALGLGEQIILFQNRRGYAPFVECTTCGNSAQCPNCDVSLTYHQARNQMRCHYCGHSTAVQNSCLACGSFTLDKKGLGTEQVETELKSLFPESTIARMDLDTTRGKHSYENIISAFEQHQTDILVGTQMVTKGLDFRNVGLVGILNADSLLNFPDYRAHERSYQLLTQVAGRAGRTQKQGKVLIQTYNPYHRILQQVTTGSFDEMFADQLYEREQFAYPPKTRLIKLTFQGRDFNIVNQASEWFTKGLRAQYGPWVLGPETPPVARVRRNYIKNTLLKVPHGHSMGKTKNGIKRIEKSFNAISKFRSIRLIYNVDHI